MRLRSLVAFSALFVSGSAFAASDVTVSVSQSSTPYVYQSGRYNVTVSNVGNQTANSVSVSITLPTTNTSPQVYVMGTVGSMASGCTRSGAVITCSLGSIRRARSATAWFDLTLPEAAEALDITAVASTTSSENSTSNNSATHTAALNNYAVALTTPDVALNQHCTGTGLTSYYECTLFPSSISDHTITLETDGSVTIHDVGPEYTGFWESLDATHLRVVYYELGVEVAEFEGYGTSTSCWEGLTTFNPDNGYVSPYRVCLQ